MPARILLIVGHPRSDSLCHAIADAYMRGARAAGAELEQLDLKRLVFARDILTRKLELQETEPDLARARELVRWSNHLVFVYPTWWGTMR